MCKKLISEIFEAGTYLLFAYNNVSDNQNNNEDDQDNYHYYNDRNGVILSFLPFLVRGPLKTNT